jgi:hypothetical protein
MSSHGHAAARRISTACARSPHQSTVGARNLVRVKSTLAVAVTLVAAAAIGCAPSPRVQPKSSADGAASEAAPFQPFTPSGGAGASAAAGGGAGGGAAHVQELVSDFEQAGGALVVSSGAPPRNGAWYTYEDNSPTCMPIPMPGTPYLPAMPPPPGSPGGGLALHALWSGCVRWGAGIAAQLNRPPAEQRPGEGSVVAYDLTGYTGLTFHVMVTPGRAGALRVMFPMTDDTQVAYGGSCDEALVGMGQCNDAHQMIVMLPTDGKWTTVTVSFADPAFRQEGWGRPFRWNPAHVTTIQIQSAQPAASYDFWIDDVYLTR